MTFKKIHEKESVSDEEIIEIRLAEGLGEMSGKYVVIAMYDSTYEHIGGDLPTKFVNPSLSVFRYWHTAGRDY